jgi:hypothetical protein
LERDDVDAHGLDTAWKLEIDAATALAYVLQRAWVE